MDIWHPRFDNPQFAKHASLGPHLKPRNSLPTLLWNTLLNTHGPLTLMNALLHNGPSCLTCPGFTHIWALALSLSLTHTLFFFSLSLSLSGSQRHSAALTRQVTCAFSCLASGGLPHGETDVTFASISPSSTLAADVSQRSVTVTAAPQEAQYFLMAEHGCTSEARKSPIEK